MSKINDKTSKLAAALDAVAKQQSLLVNAIFSGKDDPLHNFDARGLTIYRHNLQATAKRALSITFPTVLQLIGDDLFEYSCHQLLLTSPPDQGDWALWGQGFAPLLEQLKQLDDYPFVADCARVDFLRHQSERAKDHSVNLASLQLLASVDLDELFVTLPDSLALMQSCYPIVQLWQAHHGDMQDLQLYFTQAKAYLSQQPIQHYALIYRPEYKASVQEIDKTEFHWLSLLHQGVSIGKALDIMADSEFSFEQWLANAIEQRLISGFKQGPSNKYNDDNAQQCLI